MELADGPFKSMLELASKLTPDERGELLLRFNSNSEAFKLFNAHQDLAMEGQTEVLNPHVICIFIINLFVGKSK